MNKNIGSRTKGAKSSLHGVVTGHDGICEGSLDGLFLAVTRGSLAHLGSTNDDSRGNNGNVPSEMDSEIAEMVRRRAQLKTNILTTSPVLRAVMGSDSKGQW
jgi:hypothetical protein